MPTRKIRDAPVRCTDPEHSPPAHMVFEPGTYVHECPRCGHVTTFTVSHPMW